MSKKLNLVFAPIAMRETIFFSNIADLLKKNSINSSFISFYEHGDSYLLKKGYPVISFQKLVRGRHASITENEIRNYESQLGIENMREFILHEKLTFNRYDEAAMLVKAKIYFDLFDEIFDSLKADYVIQELGGFIAPMALYFSCLRRNVNHVFIEPSMFKGRVFFTKNSTNCRISDKETFDPGISEIVKTYVANYNKEKTIMAPAKDLHHFKDATLSKLVNKENIKKLKDKIVNKYFKSLSEEYDAIGNHVLRSLQMYINRKRNCKFYSHMNSDEKFIYYPFHVPLDFQLTVRSKEYLDQISLLKYISGILPYGYYLYVKEHPAGIGSYSYKEIKQLLKNQNIKFIHPSTNSYDLISASKCVVTINSKVGAEALMQNKNLIVLGETFYRGQGLTVDICQLGELKYKLKDVLHKDEAVSKDREHNLLGFFKRIYISSFPGELYLNTPKNIAEFSRSIYDFLTSCK